jgi:hypothetical protein
MHIFLLEREGAVQRKKEGSLLTNKNIFATHFINRHTRQWTIWLALEPNNLVRTFTYL